jgi:lambda repressor-like predicted transcriptional regulator
MSYIKLYRQLLNWEWFTDSKVLHVFIYCLVRSNFEKAKWQGITIERGQFITSYATIAENTGLSQNEVRTALKKLHKTKEIIVKATNKNTTITVCKYDDYQTKKTLCNKQNTNKTQTNNNQITNKSQQVRRINKNKEEEEVYTHPNLNEVIEYFTLHGYTSESAMKAYTYYSQADWTDRNGNKVKNWKQKMFSVWFKEENLKDLPKKMVY